MSRKQRQQNLQTIVNVLAQCIPYEKGGREYGNELLQIHNQLADITEDGTYTLKHLPLAEMDSTLDRLESEMREIVRHYEVNKMRYMCRY